MTLVDAMLQQEKPDLALLKELMIDLDDLYPQGFDVHCFMSQIYERGLGVPVDLAKALDLIMPRRCLPCDYASGAKSAPLRRVRLGVQLGRGEPQQLWRDWHDALLYQPDRDGELAVLYSRLPPFVSSEGDDATYEYEIRLNAALLNAGVPLVDLERAASKATKDQIQKACFWTVTGFLQRHQKSAIPQDLLSYLNGILSADDWHAYPR